MENGQMVKMENQNASLGSLGPLKPIPKRIFVPSLCLLWAQNLQCFNILQFRRLKHYKFCAHNRQRLGTTILFGIGFRGPRGPNYEGRILIFHFDPLLGSVQSALGHISFYFTAAHQTDEQMIALVVSDMDTIHLTRLSLQWRRAEEERFSFTLNLSTVFCL